MITNLRFENFTVFDDLRLSLSPRVNVVIGSNGTGKTHLLKAIYGLGLALQSRRGGKSDKEFSADVSQKFLRIFLPEQNRVGILHAKGARNPGRLTLENNDDSRISVSFSGRSKYFEIESSAKGSLTSTQPVFIPTKEVLSLVRGMRHLDHDQATLEMIFDDGYIDLAELLVRSGEDNTHSRMEDDPRLSSILRELVALVGGRYQWTEDDAFKFQPGHYVVKADPARSGSTVARAYQDSTVTRFVPKSPQAFSSSMTAEGYRKIGILHRLLSNGAINPGKTSVLLWDEPEANLNPKLMKKLVQVLLELSRNGQQIVLATHDYVLLKWLDLLVDKGKGDHVKFHTLYRHPQTQKMDVESADSYSLISKTAISDTFAELFDADMKRALGE
ncbi:AAA family ATPase [Rhizobium ruizarguesonis]|uniref:AAA family ATPase n=1 Tax=Rhizobium ruizarguesonis TaxID=2081791 RepID=UPI0010409EB9|nr:ATP-binding protein [Rhizobium ruizarguesonis]MBY5806102.1 AAA family ATPase [Rhizobium leguminosarum]TCB12240.1 AAA family ATPase [Rhizobium leguminosarum bv. viciae]MBY5846860.1 AAA family ATPase [Rhizobium leguminosarum]NEH87933.1 AAA family ATPase [Rhizobium ruizarguesonis]NEJ58072.1 AAA family ATPase [Rhizobium ruizarguesonis]